MSQNSLMEITLTGSEKGVFVRGYFAQITNNSTGIVYASQFPDGTKDDGKRIALFPGRSAAIALKDSKIYLKGTGTVSCIGTDFYCLYKAAANKNLLINPDFSVNQRGITSASGGTGMIFIADRWYASRCIVSNNGHALTAAWDGVTGTSGYIQQQIEGTAELFGKPVTVSLNIDGARRSVTLTVPTEKNQTAKASVSDDIIVGVSNFKATHISVVLFFNAVEHTITNIKAEVGACETGYEIPITADELLKCQRYYQIRSTGDIAAVDLRPSMGTITDIKMREDGTYEYIAELL